MLQRSGFPRPNFRDICMRSRMSSDLRQPHFLGSSFELTALLLKIIYKQYFTVVQSLLHWLEVIKSMISFQTSFNFCLGRVCFILFSPLGSSHFDYCLLAWTVCFSWTFWGAFSQIELNFFSWRHPITTGIGPRIRGKQIWFPKLSLRMLFRYPQSEIDLFYKD